METVAYEALIEKYAKSAYLSKKIDVPFAVYLRHFREFADYVKKHDDAIIAALLEVLKDLASESKETFSHWPELKAQVETAISKAEGRL